VPSSLLLFAGDRLSLAELCAARLDGDVVELGEAFLPADAPESAALRAQSLAPLLTPAVAVTHSGAAWVHGALASPPARHTLQRAVPWRPHHRWDRRFAYRDALLPEQDVRRIGGVAVASPERTVVDLLRRDGAGDREAAQALVLQHPDVLAGARTWSDRHAHRAGMRAVRGMLAQWTAVATPADDARRQEDVTR
jgi:hypothetical protein